MGLCNIIWKRVITQSEKVMLYSGQCYLFKQMWSY